MSQEKSSSTYTGIGFMQALALLFIGLKLGGVINWSWWWVLSPLWIPIVVFLCIFIVAMVFVLVVTICVSLWDRLGIGK